MTKAAVNSRPHVDRDRGRSWDASRNCRSCPSSGREDREAAADDSRQLSRAFVHHAEPSALIKLQPKQVQSILIAPVLVADGLSSGLSNVGKISFLAGLQSNRKNPRCAVNYVRGAPSKNSFNLCEALVITQSNTPIVLVRCTPLIDRRRTCRKTKREEDRQNRQFE